MAINQTSYERIVKNSTSGVRQNKHVKSNTVKVNPFKLFRGIAVLCTASFMFGALVTAKPNIEKLQANMENNQMVYSNVQSFEDDVIRPITHRTQDAKGYYYEWSDVKDKITTEEDFYYLDRALNNDKYLYDATRALTEYDSFHDYCVAHNYENKEDFEKQVKQKIILQHEIESKTAALNEMNEVHSVNDDVFEVGLNK